MAKDDLPVDDEDIVIELGDQDEDIVIELGDQDEDIVIELGDQDEDDDTEDEPEVDEDADDEGDDDDDDEPEDGKTFSRKYVEKLRREAKANRIKAANADKLAKELFVEKVRVLGKLEDPTDLAFDEALLTDPEALAAAVDTLLARKPHLAARVVTGDIGQGRRGDGDDFSLAGLLRGSA